MPTARTVLLAAGGLFVAAQLVPFRPGNGPVTQEPSWDSPETRALAKRACFDCHSNEAVTPWYGHVAPVSWVVRHHMDEGRAALNFSTFDQPQKEAHEAAEEVEEGEMPPGFYTPFHSEAQLSEAETAALIAGLEATLGSEHGGHH